MFYFGIPTRHDPALKEIIIIKKKKNKERYAPALGQIVNGRFFFLFLYDVGKRDPTWGSLYMWPLADSTAYGIIDRCHRVILCDPVFHHPDWGFFVCLRVYFDWLVVVLIVSSFLDGGIAFRIVINIFPKVTKFWIVILRELNDCREVTTLTLSLCQLIYVFHKKSYRERY